MLKSLVLLISSVLAIHFSFGQEMNVYSFYAVEQESNLAIPYLSLHCKEDKTAFQSNEDGLVTIHTNKPSKSFEVHHLSYVKRSFNLLNTTDTLFLQFQTFTLPEFEFNTLSGMDIIKKALDAVPYNYPTANYFLEGNYKQIHKENDRYVRYIEAAVSVEKLPYTATIQLPQEESFGIKDIRKSYNYEKNGDQHGDHLADLFKEDPLQYIEKHFLNPSNLALFTWGIKEQTSTTYEIYFQNKTWSGSRNYSGSIKINKEDYAIIAIEIAETNNMHKAKDTGGNWHFLNGWYSATFAKTESHYILQSSSKWYHHQVSSELHSSNILYNVEEQFLWTTEDKTTQKQNIPYKKMSNLYSRKMAYNSSNWDAGSLIPYRSDLELKYSLEYQFKNP